MIEFDLLETHKRLVRFGIEIKRLLNKQDIDAIADLPSYNTLLRNGIKLISINAEVRNELNTKICSHCYSEFHSEQKKAKFCSHSCSATYSNLRKSRVQWTDAQRKAQRKRFLAKGKNPPIKKVCLHCGKHFAGAEGRKYCSSLCSSEHRKVQKEVAYLEGNGGYVDNQWLYSFLVRTRGDKCSVCGIEHWNEKPIRLEVEHINGNSEDNAPDNVCLICPNCHSQTDTYKGKNKGQGRHSRRQRYAEGKSY